MTALLSTQLTHHAAMTSGVITIDIAAVVTNYRLLAQCVAPAECAAVLKADAYGLGAKQITPALYTAGCRTFFVAHAVEAIALRPLLPSDATLYVLNGISVKAVAECAQHGISPVLNTNEQARYWLMNDIAQTAALQVDTGMSRLGISLPELSSLVQDFGSSITRRIALLMSHLAIADKPENEFSEQQRQTFLSASLYLPNTALSLANSAGCFLGANYHFDLCRPGAALFGIHVSDRSLPLQPCVQVNLHIAQIRQVAAGTSVSYGCTYHANRPMRIATISAGYADGIPRSMDNNGGVWLGSQRLPVIGRICMDSFMVDATDVPDSELYVGQQVEFIGANQTLEAIGAASNTIGYEILTRLGRRYQRQYLPFIE